jgi:dTDP-4-dehydrorhamnose reductase
VRIAVTGPGGQLGHDVLRVATEAGHPVVALSRAELDLTRLDHIDGAVASLEFDVLVHCAAYTRVDDAEADPATAFQLNARAPAILAGICAGRGARMVQISTDYVFDGRASRPYGEEDPPAPLNVYGASKLTGEGLVGAAHPDGAIVVRTASLFGVAGARRAAEGTGGNFVETVLRRAGAGEPLRVVDDIVMSPTHTLDLARGILTLLERDAGPGVYHVVNGGQASWYEFARAVVDAAGLTADVEPVPASEYPMPARRPSFSVLGTEKAGRAGVEMREWREALGGYLSARR